MGKTIAAVISLGFLCWAPGVLAQQRPFITEPVTTVESGHLLFDLGVEFLQGAQFPLSGLKGDLTRVGVFGFRFGAGEHVEIQILGSIQDHLNIEERVPAPFSSRLDFAGNSTTDFGDLTLATKIRLLREGPGRPGFGFRFGVKLPNASNEKGLGTDETDFFAAFLLEKSLGRLTLFSNLGLAILGDPVDPASQDDLFLYGLAFRYALKDGVYLISDLYGRQGPGGFGTEDQVRLRLGTQLRTLGLYWDLAAFAGLHDQDPDTGIILGVSKTFSLR